MSEDLVPGEILPGEGAVSINEGRETATVTVANAGDRPVQVGSHFHFFEVNSALRFDRRAAFGMRLDVAAGTAVRFEPGEETTVDLVAIGGKRRVQGLNGLTDGALGDPSAALARAEERGFLAADETADEDGPTGDGGADG